MSATRSFSSIPSFATSFHDTSSIEEQPNTPPNISNVPPEGTLPTGKQASSRALPGTHMDCDPDETMRFELPYCIFGQVSAHDLDLPQAGPPRRNHKGQMTKFTQQISGVTKEIQMHDKWVIINNRRSFVSDHSLFRMPAISSGSRPTRGHRLRVLRTILRALSPCSANGPRNW